MLSYPWFFVKDFWLLLLSAADKEDLTTSAFLNYSFLEEEVFCGYGRYNPARHRAPIRGVMPLPGLQPGLLSTLAELNLCKGVNDGQSEPADIRLCVSQTLPI